MARNTGKTKNKKKAARTNRFAPPQSLVQSYFIVSLCVLLGRDANVLFKELAKIAFIFKSYAAGNLSHVQSLLEQEFCLADPQLDQKLPKRDVGVVLKITVKLGTADKKFLRYGICCQVLEKMLGHVAHDTAGLTNLIFCHQGDLNRRLGQKQL